MSIRHRSLTLAKDWSPPPRRRAKKLRPADSERIQRDFWLHFDLEKFASDWRRGIGKHTV
jgi:hypothetical protein